MKKLSITILDFDDIKNPLLAAGQAKATMEVGKRLVSMGHTVTVLCSKYPGYQDRTENGITYKHIGIGTKHIRFNNVWYIPSVLRAVTRVKCDVIVECFTAPVSTMCSPLFTRIPVVAIPTSFEAERFAKLYHFPFDAVERIGLRFYRYFLPYTQYLDKKMKKVNKNVITSIVPEGVDASFFQIEKKKPEYILFLGRFDIGQKGIDLLLKSYAKIAGKISYPLVIAGHGPDEQAMKQMIKDLHITDKVKIIGSTYGKKKDEVLSKALFVAFSSRHEGFSLFSLESLASGLPLAGFDIPGLSWAPETVCLKAPCFDVDSYADVLKKMTDLKLNKSMSEKARLFAKQYSWDNVANKYNEMFQLIVKKEYAK